jgi:hypothetical protein
MKEPLVFIHRFGRSLFCRFTIANERPESGQMFEPIITWTANPRPKHFEPYRRWTLYILQTLANHWSQLIAYALKTPKNTAELWLCEPGESPRLVGTLALSGSCEVIGRRRGP